jgi:glycine/D-amino acid oxidase-like deaminating enzyme
MAVATFSVFDGPRSRRALPRVAIIGAGVAGLGIGWRLAEAGCQVTVFERGEAGHGASWAAAGMLAAGLEAEPGEERCLRCSKTESSTTKLRRGSCQLGLSPR